MVPVIVPAAPCDGPAAALTLFLLHRYGLDNPGTNRLIQLILGSALLVTAIALMFRPQLARLAYKAGKAHPPNEARTLAWTVLTGVGKPWRELYW